MDDVMMIRPLTTRRVRSSALGLLLLLSTASFAAAQDAERLTGRWSGAIEVSGTELRVQLSFTSEAGTLSGTIDIPQQGAEGVPLTGIRVTGDSAVFSIQGIPGEPTFRGVFEQDGDVLAGAFHQAAAVLSFRVTREGAAGPGPDPLDGFDAQVEQALADFRVPGVAIGIVRDGRVVYSRGFGFRDLESRLPVTPQTVFAIGSSTKAFTTYALGLQVDQGRFNWERPAREYLPGLQLWDPITTAQLSGRDMVTHRSGLPRHDLVWYNNREGTAAELFRRLRHFEPNRQLREQWQYNNIMYVLAGHLLAELSGTSWADAIRRDVFEPLRMTSSSLSVDAMQQAPDFALPYRERGDSLVRMNFRNIDNVGPAGSINSNIDDMLRWAQLHVGNGRLDGTQLIQPATLRDMHTPHMVMPGLPPESELSPASYGLGWIIQTYRGRYRVQHGGNIDGFSALVTLFPRDGTAVVVLANKNGTPLPSLLTDHAADRMFGLAARDWLGEAHARVLAARAQGSAPEDRVAEERRPNTRHAFAIADYAGDYEHPGYGPLRIRHENGRLSMVFNDIHTPLEHWHYEVFSGLENVADPTFHRSRIQFSSDLRGRVAAVSVAMEPFVPPIRFERQPDARLRDPSYVARFAGRYTLQGAGAQLNVTVQGGQLVLEVPGQPLFPLEPDRDDEFSFANLEGYRVRFISGRDGAVQELRLIQPNGIFIATRVP
jgi:CubicO group peptidase (beta-lactamase class C family)